jgi:hypothetical protein
MVLNVKSGVLLNNSIPQFYYYKRLNEPSVFEVILEGLTADEDSNLVIGTSIFDFYINDSAVEDFRGLAMSKKNIEGGAISIKGIGREIELMRTRATATDWSATASATIFTTMIGWSGDWTADSIAAGLAIDFRASASNSIWNELKNLIDKTGQDIVLDYHNMEIDIENSAGSAQTASLIEEINIKNISFEEKQAEAKKVIVYGKGFGSGQKSGSADDSYSTGDPVKVIIDRTITTDAEAAQRATIELAKLKDNIKTYRFQVTDLSINPTLGDTYTLDAPSARATAETVRVVGIKRGWKNNKEFLELDVTNEAYSQALKNSAMNLSILDKIVREGDSTTQPTADDPSSTSVTGGVTAGPSITSVSGSVNNYTLTDSIDSATASSTALAVGWNNDELSVDFNGTYGMAWVHVKIEADFADSGINIGLKLNGLGLSAGSEVFEYWSGLDTAINTVLIEKVYPLVIRASTTGTLTLDVYTNNADNYNLSLGLFADPSAHTHTDTFGTTDDNHPHADDIATTDANHLHE